MCTVLLSMIPPSLLEVKRACRCRDSEKLKITELRGCVLTLGQRFPAFLYTSVLLGREHRDLPHHLYQRPPKTNRSAPEFWAINDRDYFRDVHFAYLKRSALLSNVGNRVNRCKPIRTANRIARPYFLSISTRVKEDFTRCTKYQPIV